jgi:hypothetical protein
MKYLLLDIDGVLATPKQWKNGRMIAVPSGRSSYGFDRKCVKRLKTIIEQTECVVILTSTWRKLYPLEDIEWLLKKHGLSLVFHGKTSYVANSGRGREIDEYLCYNKINAGYVVIDDDVFDMGNLDQDRIVKCDSNIGLQDKGMNDAIRILNRLQFDNSERGDI